MATIKEEDDTVSFYTVEPVIELTTVDAWFLSCSIGQTEPGPTIPIDNSMPREVHEQEIESFSRSEVQRRLLHIAARGSKVVELALQLGSRRWPG
jgi:hypothetical protein